MENVVCLPAKPDQNCKNCKHWRENNSGEASIITMLDSTDEECFYAAKVTNTLDSLKSDKQDLEEDIKALLNAFQKKYNVHIHASVLTHEQAHIKKVSVCITL